MEEKARIYAAMKRGDVEDLDERYAVDFDKKWAEKDDKADDSEQDDDSADEAEEVIEYTDEFGRTRTGTRFDAARVQRQQAARSDLASDRFTARPPAPTNIIYGDTIQTSAFNPDISVEQQMEELAAKRDKSLTPPPDEHFNSRAEVRTKGTGFFTFSDDQAERKRQMEGLEAERAETERRRQESKSKVDERKAQIEARKREIAQKRGKRKADEFLEELGVEMEQKQSKVETANNDAMEKIEAAIERDRDGDSDEG